MRLSHAVVVSFAMALLSFGCDDSEDEPANNPPTAYDDVINTDVNTSVDFDVTANDVDPDADALTVISNTTPALGTVTLLGGGTIRYTPPGTMTGTVTFDYTISDGHDHTATATIVVIVNSVGVGNNPPTATPDSASTALNTAVTINVISNDVDPDLDSPVVVSGAHTEPANGTVVDNANGTFTYTPDTGFEGTDTFQYQITDGNQGYDIGIVTIHVFNADALASDTMTRNAVADLLNSFDDGSDEDFAGISADFEAAMTLDPSNKNPIFWKAMTDFLLWLQQTMLDPSDAIGKGRVLYESMGMVNADVSVPKTLRTMDLQEVTHTQGDYIDTFPTTDDVDDFVYGELRNRIAQLVTDLDAVPVDFEYAMEMDVLVLNWDGDPETRWLDHGDVSAIQTMLCMVVAYMDLMMGWDFGNVDINADFDEADLVAADAAFEMDFTYITDLLETKYTDTLLPISARWNSARARIDMAFEYAKEASQHVRNETFEQQDNGILTLGRDTFDTATEREEFLADEARYRAWGENVVNALYTNIHTQTTDPDGDPIVAEDQITLNLNKFFGGVNLRSLIYRPISFDDDDDPLTEDVKSIGFLSVDDYTLDLATIDGVVLALAGNAMTVNDAQTFGTGSILPLVVIDVAAGTKVIDGFFTDWSGSSMTQVAMRPFASISAPRPDVGEVFVAKDMNTLFIYVSANLTNATRFSSYTIRAETDTISREASRGHLDTNVDMASGAGGIEVSIPIAEFAGAGFVTLSVEAEWPDPMDLGSREGCYRGMILISIQQ
jgi:hypothetical protein